MKKFGVVLLISLSFFSCKSSKQLAEATVNSQGNLVGIVHKSDFLKAPFNSWFSENYDDYLVDMDVVNQIKPLLGGIKIKAVMGTWCGDSRRETPHFYKILEVADFDFANLTMITVDRNKATPNNDQAGLDIGHVPTFIFYKDGKELNRFVEYPRETLEKDILNILKENGYKHSYLQ